MYAIYQQIYGRGVQPLLLFILPTAFLALVYILFGSAPSLFVFDRAAIANGEIWRLLTCHFVHSGLNHLIMNAIASSLIMPFVRSFKRIIILLAFLCPLIATGIWIFLPHVSLYCGASGLLNGVLCWAFLVHWRKEPHWSYGLIFLGAIIKTVLEIAEKQSVFNFYQWPPLPESHLIGMAAAGMLILVSGMMKYEN